MNSISAAADMITMFLYVAAAVDRENYSIASVG